MRLFIALLTAFQLVTQVGTAQSSLGFTGLWKLNSARSEIRSLPTPPDETLKVDQTATALTVTATPQEGAPASTATYPLDGTSKKRQVGSSTMNTVTKWEGPALLVNTLVSGPSNYTLMERWVRSRDGDTLTIRRTIVRQSGESESTLVYENPAAAIEKSVTDARPTQTPPRMIEHDRPSDPEPSTPETPPDYVVASGTRVLLRLTNTVNTKTSAPGDRIYLETAVPIFVDTHLIIPRGSYVAGTVVDTKRAGRVKGKSAFDIRFDSLTLPNGITRDLRSRPSAADTQGSLDRKEGKIEGEGNKGGDARTVGTTTAAGAGIGGIAGAATGHLGMGAGIGAAAGAAAGLGRVLSSRGPDVVLPAGTTVELMLDRDLHFTAAELRHSSR